MCTEKV